MLTGVSINCHSSIKIKKNKVIYIDPFRIEEKEHDADLIFITHSHYDHFSEDDILKIKNVNTVIILTQDVYSKALELGVKEENIIIIKPNKKYRIDDIYFETIYAYNTDKQFHLKDKKWVGYIIEINNIKYYIAGDTDITKENKKVKCDVAFVPIGGTYTMDYKQAAMLVNIIKPKIVVPTHYGEIIGNKEDANKFKKLIDEKIQSRIII